MVTSSPALFSTVPEKDYLSFFPKGPDHPRCEEVVAFLSLKKADVARAAGVTRASVRYDERIPVDLRARIVEWATLVNHVAGHFRGSVDKTGLWFTMPNPLLGGLSPRDMIRYGRFARLWRFVQGALQQEL